MEIEKKMKCLACSAEFSSVDQQRVHYRSEWHRYNLQRQVAELPCVTEQDFNEKLQLQNSAEDATKGTPAVFHCEVCVKSFLSENVLRDHLTSKKHLVQLAKASKSGGKMKGGAQRVTPASTEKSASQVEATKKPESKRTGKLETGEKHATVPAKEDEENEEENSDAESWETDVIGFEECLFCGTLSETFEANCVHMERAHLFFIPDVDYCVDLDGLYSCISERIALYHDCLWCGRTLRSKRAAQQHMLAKQHCRLRYEDEYILDYADYYDYERVGESGAEKTDAESSTTDSAEVRYSMTPAEREELLALLAADDAFELVLPSGVTIGHRSLARYYRQNLGNREQSNAQSRKLHINAGMARSAITYRPNGAQRSVLRADELAALELRARDVMHLRRELQNRVTKIGIQANKLQRHFRKQIL